MEHEPRRLDGAGALLFLASFGAIAYFVQTQTVPDARVAPQTPATVTTEPAEEVQPQPALPWEDRLSLSALQLEPIRTGVATPDPANPGAVAALPEVTAENGAYVQTLNDGHRILWTLDPVLQESALTIFRNREVPYAGAVVLDLRDNAVLAFAGHSSADDQVDPLEVLTTAWAPAASTFKLVTAASLLENEDATPASKVCFFGGLHGITDDALRDDPTRDTRCESLSAAIAHSYNLVIGKLALRGLEQQELVSTAHRMQYEASIPFEFPVERSPIDIPSEPNARAKVAAGFWHVDLSPLHGAVIASIFARGGNFQAPHLVREVHAPDGSTVTPDLAPKTRVLAEDVANSVGAMMVKTTTEGTARKSFKDRAGTRFIPNVNVAAKTGSLTGKRAPSYNYNWFIGFAPAEDPEIAFAVLLANEPAWKIKAHYAGRRLVQIYLERRAAVKRARDLRLAADGVRLQARDPETGALIAERPEGQPATNTGTTPPPEAPLPPVPGPRAAPPPLPAPTTDAVPETVPAAG